MYTLVKQKLPKTTKVFDTYWNFAAERQSIFFRRQTDELGPWTVDTILRKHKFTNAYRASDRVSQYLIKNVIYTGSQNAEEMFFRILLFKLFNKIGTWELFLENIGIPEFKNFKFEQYDNILSQALENGRTIYSAAYIMTSGKSAFGHPRKHRNHLELIQMMMKEKLPQKIGRAKSFEEVYETLLSLPTIGSFLGYQFAIDLNYSELINFDENEFVIAGPGALDGIKKCFFDTENFTSADIIRLMVERQESEFTRLGLNFQSLWGRQLKLIDCQNIFCEVDKYARVVHPEVRGESGRTRIKQIFRPLSDQIEYWFPPKWGINHKIKRHTHERTNDLLF